MNQSPGHFLIIENAADPRHNRRRDRQTRLTQNQTDNENRATDQQHVGGPFGVFIENCEMWQCSIQQKRAPSRSGGHPVRVVYDLVCS
jgi:hypothetical protein